MYFSLLQDVVRLGVWFYSRGFVAENQASDCSSISQQRDGVIAIDQFRLPS
jgi:hypothetical protein